MRNVHACRAGASLLTILALCAGAAGFAQEAGRTAVIWHDRGDAAALDLAGGPGGKAHEPGIDPTFIKESDSGTSPKFEVEDEHGTRWKVKLGEEAKSETAATRLLWAAGYVVDEDYYRPQIRVLGLPRLARGQEFVSTATSSPGRGWSASGGGSDESTTWSWYDNPFVGTREFNGLRVMMALVNNWDLKDVNNRVSDTADGGGQYGITDLGATFGRTGNIITRSKSVSKDYAETKFIDKVTPTHVDFVMQSRPFFPFIVHLPNYRFRTRMESVVKRIPIADARWIGDRLGRSVPGADPRLLPRQRILARRGRDLCAGGDAAHRGVEGPEWPRTVAVARFLACRSTASIAFPDGSSSSRASTGPARARSSRCCRSGSNRKATARSSANGIRRRWCGT